MDFSLYEVEILINQEKHDSLLSSRRIKGCGAYEWFRMMKFLSHQGCLGFLEQKISHFFSGSTHFLLNEILLSPQYIKQKVMIFPPFNFFLL